MKRKEFRANRTALGSVLVTSTNAQGSSDQSGIDVALRRIFSDFTRKCSVMTIESLTPFAGSFFSPFHVFPSADSPDVWDEVFFIALSRKMPRGRERGGWEGGELLSLHSCCVLLKENGESSARAGGSGRDGPAGWENRCRIYSPKGYFSLLPPPRFLHPSQRARKFTVAVDLRQRLALASSPFPLPDAIAWRLQKSGGSSSGWMGGMGDRRCGGIVRWRRR
jgi:hypothetical protein